MIIYFAYLKLLGALMSDLLIFLFLPFCPLLPPLGVLVLLKLRLVVGSGIVCIGEGWAVFGKGGAG